MTNAKAALNCVSETNVNYLLHDAVVMATVAATDVMTGACAGSTKSVFFT